MSHAVSVCLLVLMKCLIHCAFVLFFSFPSCCVSTSPSEPVAINIFPWGEWNHNLESDPITTLLFWGYIRLTVAEDCLAFQFYFIQQCLDN